MVLGLFVIVCFLGLAAMTLVPAEYKAEATVALVPPASEESPKANRYLLLGGLNPARDIVMKSLGSDESRESIIGDRDGATYELEPDFTTNAPIIVVTAVGTSPADANEVLSAVLTAIPTTLVSLQDQIGTDTRSRIDALVVAQDVEAQRAGKKQIRAVVAVTGAVGALGLLIIGAIDGLLLRRRRKATGGRISPTVTEPVPQDDRSRTDPRDTPSASTRNGVPVRTPARTTSVRSGKSGDRVGPRDG